MRALIMVVKHRRSKLLLTSALVGGVFLRLGDTALAAAPTYQFDIPAEPLSQALTDFSQAASQQIIYSESLVKGRKAPGLHGSYTAAEALNALLAGTDLTVDINPSGVLMIEARNDRNKQGEVASYGSRSLQRASFQAAAQDNTPAAAAPPTGPAPAPPPAAEATEPNALETVVVTGSTSKRTLLDASVAITSISNVDL